MNKFVYLTESKVRKKEESSIVSTHTVVNNFRGFPFVIFTGDPSTNSFTNT